jgi:hypothetical protein
MLCVKHRVGISRPATALTVLDILNAERALIFRIVHRDNIPWILSNGLHCRKSQIQDPNFVPIGLKDLIDKRDHQRVPCAPGGTLSNYVPFYFTPLSPMAYRIKTGSNVTQRYNSEIVVVVTSLRTLVKHGVSFLFTDRHASVIGARFTNNLEHLDRIDWSILQHKDFERDNEDLGKSDRYQAEALVRRAGSGDSITKSTGTGKPPATRGVKWG